MKHALETASVSEILELLELLLRKPHLATHRRQDFVDVNITGALTYSRPRRRRAFFRKEDDNPVTWETYADEKAKVNEHFYRRVDLEYGERSLTGG
jgi:hypothetical protein